MEDNCEKCGASLAKCDAATVVFDEYTGVSCNGELIQCEVTGEVAEFPKCGFPNLIAFSLPADPNSAAPRILTPYAR